jgi:ankyrin repeat protein
MELSQEYTQILIASGIFTDGDVGASMAMLEYLGQTPDGAKLLLSDDFNRRLMSNVSGMEAFSWMLDNGKINFDGTWNYVIASKNTEMLELAMAKGLSIKAADDNGCQILQWAAANGNEGAVQLLLSKGADINHQDARGGTALMEAAMLGNSNLVKTLLAAGANPMLLEDDGNSALDHALQNKSPENSWVINKLRELGVPEGQSRHQLRDVGNPPR